MRKAIPLFVFLLATSAFAQKNTFSVFVSNPSGGYSNASGHVFNGGYGFAYERSFTNRWSAALSVADEQYHFRALHVGGGVDSFADTVYPVDLVARYHIFNGARWRPYAGAGLRYVSSPIGPDNYRLTPELNVGTAFQLSRRWSLFVDLKQGVRSETGPRYDPLTKTSFGVRFSF